MLDPGFMCLMSPRGLSRDYLSFLCARWSHLCLSFSSCPLKFLITYFISYLSCLGPSSFSFPFKSFFKFTSLLPLSGLLQQLLNKFPHCSYHLLPLQMVLYLVLYKSRVSKKKKKVVSRQAPPATQATRVNEMTQLQVMGERSHFLSRKLNSFLKFSRCNQTHLRVWI